MIPIQLLLLYPAVILNIAEIASSAVGPPCLQYLQEVLEGHHAVQLFKFAEYSGKGVNQVGSYDSCLKMQSSKYFVGYLTIDQEVTPAFVGFCTVPCFQQSLFELSIFIILLGFTDKCSATDIQELISTVSPEIGLGNIVEPSKILGQLKWDWASSILVSFLALCIVMTLVSSYLVCKKKSKSQKQFGVLVRSFCLQNTFRKLTRPDQVKCLNGLRSLSLLAVFTGKPFFLCLLMPIVILVLGHILAVGLLFATNIATIQLQVQKLVTTIALSFQYAVDTFFYIGGFLLGYLYLKSQRNRHPQNAIVSYFLGILTRALRFWPLLFLTVFIFWKIVPLLGNGPLYFVTTQFASNCSNNWLPDVFFYNNFVDEVTCLPWAWYLSADLQLFAVAVLILTFYIKVKSNHLFRKLVLGLAFSLGLAGLVYCTAMIQIKGYRALGNIDQIDQKAEEYARNIYNKPWSRVTPYFLGLLLGILYQQQAWKKSIDQQTALTRFLKKRQARILMMLVGSFLVLFFTFAPYSLTQKAVWPQLYHTLYLGFGRTLYCLGLALFTLPLQFGYTNPFSMILDSSILQYVAKVSFSTYMIHFLVVLWQTLSAHTTQYLTPWAVVRLTASGFVLALALGSLLTVCFEYPISSLLRTAVCRLYPQGSLKPIRQQRSRNSEYQLFKETS